MANEVSSKYPGTTQKLQSILERTAPQNAYWLMGSSGLVTRQKLGHHPQFENRSSSAFVIRLLMVGHLIPSVTHWCSLARWPVG